MHIIISCNCTLRNVQMLMQSFQQSNNFYSDFRCCFLIMRSVILHFFVLRIYTCTIPYTSNSLRLDTTLCDKVSGRWFSPGTPFSYTNKTDCHDITEILLKVALNTITLA